MKKIIICLMLVLTGFLGFSLETGQNSLTGSWNTHVFLAEGEDGLLINPDAEYAFPFLGISRIDILDSGFILFLIEEREYRAFYEAEMLDFDNYHLTCTFKSGEEFILKLVRLEDESWKFLYRIGSDSVLAPDVETAGDPETESSMPEEAAEPEARPDAKTAEQENPEGIKERSERLFIGILVKE